MPPKPKALTTDEITERIRTGHKFIERGIADRDRIHCKRFLDGSEAAALLLMADDWDGEGILPDSQEIGSVNYLAVNVMTKTASIAIGDPDWHIETHVDDPAEIQQAQALGLPPPLPSAEKAAIVRQYLRDLWKTRRWARVTRKALLKRSISGMGCVAYLWNADKGPVLEHVRVRDIAVDPNVVDWRNPRWAARRIKMPRADAAARWTKQAYLFTAQSQDIPNLDEPHPLNKEIVELWCYWDMESKEGTEAVFYGETELERGPNLYGKIPLVWLEGDILPETEFSGGDYDVATQHQIQLARLNEQINDQAENGGAIGWVNTALLDDASESAFENGKPSAFVQIKGNPEDVFGYVNGMPINPAVLEVFRIQMQALDSATGVSEYQRGVLSQRVQFATEAALLSNQSGSRGNQARIEFEQFHDELGKAILEITRKFAASLMDAENEEEHTLLEAIQSVTDICVIESSTAYKDPAADQQSNVQLLQIAMPFIQAGMVNPLPLLADLFRSFGKRDVSKYLNMQANSAQAAPSAFPMSPGGNPAPAQEPAARPESQDSGPAMPPNPGAVAHILHQAGIV